MGLELMRESGKPMEFGIFDFYKVFSRAFVKGVMGQLGFEWKPGDVITTPDGATFCPGDLKDAQSFAFFSYIEIRYFSSGA